MQYNMMEVEIRSVIPPAQFQSPPRVWKKRNNTDDQSNNTYNNKRRRLPLNQNPFGDFEHQCYTSRDGCFSLFAQLKGHTNAINGIGFPLGSNKVCSSSSDDDFISLWDSNTATFCSKLGLGGKVSCLITDSEWIFVGILPGFVKALNTQTHKEITLNASSNGGEGAPVHSLIEAGNALICAGTHSGVILVWKYDVPATTSSLDPCASLTGHTAPVVSLAVTVPSRMYSGSVDTSIKVWDIERFQCLQSLDQHTEPVTSLLCWEQYLLSSSLDRTIKVWAMSQQTEDIELVYTHTDSNGLLKLAGISDAQDKPILLCSCNDNSLRLYALPSFKERGKIFSKEEIGVIQVGPTTGFFSTGHATGDLKLWKLAGSFHH